MTPTETLKHEHQIISLVLDAAEREAGRIQRMKKADARRIGSMLDFFRNFADRCHHAKEERLLFARLRERGMPGETGPIAVMLLEHEEGRRRLSAVADALPGAEKGDAGALASVKDNLTVYVDLLRSHIRKEDGVLYPKADALLTSQDQEELAAAFETIEAREMGEGTHEKYHELAHRLAGEQ